MATKRFASLSLSAAIGVLSAVAFAAASAAACVEYARAGAMSAAAVGAAAVTCWVASVLSLVLSSSWRRTPQAITGILAGVLVRMTLPMGVAVLSQAVSGPLAKAGLFGWIVCFFLLTLVVETLLLVRLLRSSAGQPAASTWSKGS
ncbi:MAG TPA: hypothetical protein VMV69_30855 [Pirellulales bacterium]|nr:hypothetical protein [Pirellulales bacterium]